MDEILHFVIAEHRTTLAPNLFKDIIKNVKEVIGEEELNKKVNDKFTRGKQQKNNLKDTCQVYLLGEEIPT